ncbi:type VII secretion-associated serine protease mycosin [Streptomyces sp. SID161]|uniref:type VII secretion-associated serine protease mycosin n=1 Tax=Streptomyces sp. SID161 TaxID=2690251 RepID=UPI00136977F5|nr:type VII secretion-associated serine protease mycosin [Streptomyces sp. SID161]MYW16776.1 type VII secretion-associated serine protease mycosin [Streptomyces sp. SID2955]MYW46202.1 type VII secretion-associated serine protease mycosin [Streptomyces sp. SID161]
MTMRSRSRQAGWRSRAVSVAVGTLLASLAVTPAHADTVRERQWYLDAMHADEMWKSSTGKGITVAVIDTGVQADIPDLRGQVVAGKDFSKRAGDERTDYDGHGTTMAVLIAGTGAKGASTGSYGLAPGAKITPIRIPGFMERNRTDGNQDDFPTAAAKAIRFAADSDAQIISISAASTANSQELTEAVAYALSKGKLIFAGVGNDGDTVNEIEYPAATPGVVGVGAIDRNVKATKESEHGPQVDLVAPGEDIISACLGGTELCNSHGTSDATALASASAALIWSKHPNWTNNQVLRVMLNTASKPTSGKKRTDYLGYGAIRPRIALSDPGDPGPGDVYPLPDFKQAASKTPNGSPTTSAKDDSSPPMSASASKSDRSSLPWILGGVGAVVVAGGALAAGGIRRRRRAATMAQAHVAVPPGPGQTPWYGDSNYGGRP